MRLFLLLLLTPLSGMSQYKPGEKLSGRASIITDSGTVHGYFVLGADSTVILSRVKRYSANSTTTIPVNSIREMHMKTKNQPGFGVAAAVFVLGFTVTAGLTKNSGDFDNDGKTSFFELILTAIEGSTSGNRRRRNTALIVGGAGGTLALAAYLFSSNRLSFVFPLSNRRSYYDQKRGEINKYVKF
jgi:hypothetical protein